MTLLIPYLIPALVTLLVAILSYLGGRHKSHATATLDEAKAGEIIDKRWKALNDVTAERLNLVEGQVVTLQSKVTILELNLRTTENANADLIAHAEGQSKLMRSLARWALRMRDDLLTAKASVPPIPQDVELALHTMEGVE